MPLHPIIDALVGHDQHRHRANPFPEAFPFRFVPVERCRGHRFHVVAELLDLTVAPNGEYLKRDIDKIGLRLINEAHTSTTTFIADLDKPDSPNSLLLARLKVMYADGIPTDSSKRGQVGTGKVPTMASVESPQTRSKPENNPSAGAISASASGSTATTNAASLRPCSIT